MYLAYILNEEELVIVWMYFEMNGQINKFKNEMTDL